VEGYPPPPGPLLKKGGELRYCVKALEWRPPSPGPIGPPSPVLGRGKISVRGRSAINRSPRWGWERRGVGAHRAPLKKIREKSITHQPPPPNPLLVQGGGQGKITTVLSDTPSRVWREGSHISFGCSSLQGAGG
jgi:hypothetical protein